MAVEPIRGRAAHVEGTSAPQADLTSALFEEYGAQIFRYCLHQLGSREEAEDAVQSTFLNAFRGIKRGIVPELESAWLFKIAQNVCLSRRRSSWRRDRIESPADFGLVAEVTPAPSRRAEELIGLQDVLERMPESQRRAILLREWQGLSYHEIADELELTQAAVETLIFRARRSLAQGLEQPEPKRRRSIRGVDLGSVLAGAKSLLLGGGAAVKVAATIAIVSATTVVAASPIASHHHTTRRQRPAAPRIVEARTVPTIAALRPASAPAAVGHRAAIHAAAAPQRIRPASTLQPVDTAPTAAPVDTPAQQAAPPPSDSAPAPPPATAPAASSPVTAAPAAPTPATQDNSPTAPVVVPQPSSSGDGSGSVTPAPGQMPTVVPTPVTLSSPPADSSASSPAPTPAPAGSTPASGSSGSSATVVPPVSVLPASPPSKLSVQPPSVTGVHSSSNP